MISNDNSDSYLITSLDFIAHLWPPLRYLNYSLLFLLERNIYEIFLNGSSYPLQGYKCRIYCIACSTPRKLSCQWLRFNCSPAIVGHGPRFWGPGPTPLHLTWPEMDSSPDLAGSSLFFWKLVFEVCFSLKRMIQPYFFFICWHNLHMVI